jgi:cell division protein FtsN
VAAASAVVAAAAAVVVAVAVALVLASPAAAAAAAALLHARCSALMALKLQPKLEMISVSPAVQQHTVTLIEGQ